MEIAQMYEDDKVKVSTLHLTVFLMILMIVEMSHG